ncbi:MAG: hypothetical protein RMK91_11990 [Pseudanabaenaceae cyanobacterium SKYGB_i_bin29]|nr:hypothetical protein [Pseudanabaenaceae cyanobacterium SKYG29]MDW8422575.1 hypothetical protein [Pseudanabaenaceae cyanobacterium SKYGB_i_bin29]
MRSMLAKILTGVVSAALVSGVACADPRPTDQDAYPGNFPPDFANNFPATYGEVYTKVLDLTSDLNIQTPFFEIEFGDQKFQRQFNAFRSIVREMLELQNNSDPLIRTRDLANPYTTALSSYCSYYQQLNIEQPGCIKEEPIVLTPSEPVLPPPAIRPAPPPPVPALW